MTSKEFAEIIGVSQSTISRALNNSSQISVERREFIQKKAEEPKDKPHRHSGDPVSEAFYRHELQSWTCAFI